MGIYWIKVGYFMGNILDKVGVFIGNLLDKSEVIFISNRIPKKLYFIRS
jgi:hypothetical protein